MTTVAGLLDRADLERSALDEFRRATPASRAQWERLAEVTPAAFLSASGLMPYPVFVEAVDGAYPYDVDGRAILDFFAAHNGALLGHNHPAVRQAVHEEVDRGLMFGLIRSTREAEVGEALVERIPSLEKVRFNPTGSEAVMRALRVARAFTGRDRIAKTDIGYHGSQDLVWYGHEIAHVQHPGTRTLAPGISTGVTDDVVLLPFDQAERTAELVAANASSLAAILVEPVLGASGRPASPEYLQLLRELATRHSIVLIFEEMICLGAARGGVQELLGVTPDMTTAGKTVAHGFPLSFYGGRADIMAVTGRGLAREVPSVIHGGTYQRHNVALAAAAAALEKQDAAFFAGLQATGESVRQQLRTLATAKGWPVEVTGIAHMWNLQVPSAPWLRPLLQLMLLNRAIYLGGVVSGAHTDQHLTELVTALGDALGRVEHLL